jgi:hypothetical protein
MLLRLDLNQDPPVNSRTLCQIELRRNEMPRLRRPFRPWRAASLRSAGGIRTQRSPAYEASEDDRTPLPRGTADENRTRDDRFEGPATHAIRVTAAGVLRAGLEPAVSCLRGRRDIRLLQRSRWSQVREKPGGPGRVPNHTGGDSTALVAVHVSRAIRDSNPAPAG